MQPSVLDEASFRLLVEHLPGGILVGAGKKIVYLNQSARTLFGAQPGELLGTPVLERFPPEARTRNLARMQAMAEHPAPAAPAEETMLRADGSEVAVEISAIPFRFQEIDGALLYLRDLTEERNFRTIIDRLPAGVFIQTRGRFALINREALRMLGASSSEEVVGTPVLDRVPPEFHPVILNRIRRLSEGREVVEPVEHDFLKLDGQTIAVKISSVPLRFQGENGALVFIRDLTQEKESESKILVQDELLKLTGSMAQVGGWDIDTATGKGTWTEEVARIHDLDPSVLPDMDFGLKFYEPESRTRLDAALQAAVTQAVPFDLVLQLVSALGRKKWVRSQGTPTVVDGRVVRIKGIFQDVTESHRAAQAVLEEKERLQVTLRSIGDGVITTDTEGRVVLMSRSAEELTGWPQAEARGRSVHEVMPLVHEWTKKPLENPVVRVLREGQPSEMALHTSLLSKDGRERIIADSAAPILDAAGTITGVVVVFRDMTEKQKLAEAVQRAQNLESIGLLAAGIAHDFNNLLSGLFGQIQLAQDKVKRGRVTEAEVNFDRALGVFDRARDLTGQLLTFSKGGLPVRVPLDLVPLVRRTVQFALAGSNVDARFELAPDLRPLLGDPNQLAQAVENLVINARQAMPSGGTVTITAELVVRPEGRFAVIGVEDQGPGIPPETLSRIFDPFYTTKTGGHGLGLAAVLSIVQRHEGRVEVTSPPGEGARFQIWLPAG